MIRLPLSFFCSRQNSCAGCVVYSQQEKKKVNLEGSCLSLFQFLIYRTQKAPPTTAQQFCHANQPPPGSFSYTNFTGSACTPLSQLLKTQADEIENRTPPPLMDPRKCQTTIKISEEEMIAKRTSVRFERHQAWDKSKTFRFLGSNNKEIKCMGI